MVQNESKLDRIIRAVAGVVLLYVGLGGVLTGTTAIIANIIGVVLLTTAAIGFCPLYASLKLNTLKK
ncbi:MAG TPA: DUF2892 domain-containing protein [Anaerolineales bacterium]